MAINHKTWQRLLDAILEINSAENHTSFGEAVVAGLSKLVVADVTIFHVLDRKTQCIVTHMSPPMPFTEEELAYYAAHSEENPLASYYSGKDDPKARRMSDVIDQAKWESSTFYRKCCQRLGLAYSLVLPVAVDASVVVALSFERSSSDFTVQDCQLLDAFGPHLRLAWQRHENPWADRREVESRKRLQSLGLSPRESEVLYWMTEGKLNREIATLLGIALGTVQDNVARILDKLRMENRHAATVFAISKLRS